MVDPGEPLAPIVIDDRSPGERMAERAGASLDHLRQAADEGPFDFAAFLWMVLVLTTVGVDVWARLDLVTRAALSTGADGVTLSGTNGWTKIAALASTSGYPLAAACIIGLAAAAVFRGRMAVATVVLAALGSTWVAACGAMTFAVALHHADEVISVLGTDNRAVGAVSGLATVVLGLIGVWVASRLIPLLGPDYVDDELPEVS